VSTAEPGCLWFVGGRSCGKPRGAGHRHCAEHVAAQSHCWPQAGETDDAAPRTDAASIEKLLERLPATSSTDAELLEALKIPEFRAEAAIQSAKTGVDLWARVAQAIRDAVKQERQDVDQFLAARLDRCASCGGDWDGPPCAACMDVARVRDELARRPER